MSYCTHFLNTGTNNIQGAHSRCNYSETMFDLTIRNLCINPVCNGPTYIFSLSLGMVLWWSSTSRRPPAQWSACRQCSPNAATSWFRHNDIWGTVAGTTAAETCGDYQFVFFLFGILHPNAVWVYQLVSGLGPGVRCGCTLHKPWSYDPGGCSLMVRLPYLGLLVMSPAVPAKRAAIKTVEIPTCISQCQRQTTSADWLQMVRENLDPMLDFNSYIGDESVMSSVCLFRCWQPR